MSVVKTRCDIVERHPHC